VCALYPTLAASKQAASRHIYTYLFNNNEFVGFPNFELWFGGREGGRQVGPKCGDEPQEIRFSQFFG